MIIATKTIPIMLTPEQEALYKAGRLRIVEQPIPPIRVVSFNYADEEEEDDFWEMVEKED